MIADLHSLRALYRASGERALRKPLPALDRHSIAFVALSPFVLLSTAGQMINDPMGIDTPAEDCAQMLERYAADL